MIYASLFDLPLTLAQLHASVVGVRAVADPLAGCGRDSDLLQATIERRDGCYVPAGRHDLIDTR